MGREARSDCLILRLVAVIISQRMPLEMAWKVISEPLSGSHAIVKTEAINNVVKDVRKP